jgi:hypothetical protein
MGKFTVNRGTTFSLDVIYKKNGVAASLAGATIRFTMKAVEYDTDTSDAGAAVVKNITAHVSESEGLSNITLNPADTATLTPGTYFYDIKVKESLGAVYKLDEGKITLDGSPTNRLV